MRIENTLPKSYFARYDESDDRHFYVYPRLTAHIDEQAISALGQIFREELPQNGRILDLMSSYYSHIPSDIAIREMIGVGLNAEEMALNNQLTHAVIQDLNKQPRLDFADNSFDAAICTVSAQYLTRPVEVFAEVGRVLRPGAPFIVTFSNRCFPSKAVHIWVVSSDTQRAKLLKTYFQHAGCFENLRCLDRSPNRWLSDPLFAVIGRKQADPALV